MSGTTSPTAAYVDLFGIHAPTFQDIVAYLGAQYQAIYGQDIVITDDSQDGQLIGVFALAISDANAACIAVYNSFSPTTAQGVGLSSVVAINGMQRQMPSNSTVDLLVTGVAGTLITNGVAQDVNMQYWLLPASVPIPPSGQTTVTATAQQAGAVLAQPGDVSTISTPTRGWQTVTNPTAASAGAPVEDDAELRARQAMSTALPAQSVLDGIIGAVDALPSVTAVKGYENDTNTDYTVTPPPVGEAALPPHSISLVVQGGDATQVCQTILDKKTPGCYTYGSTRVTVNDLYGLPHDIGFFVPTPVPIGIEITLHALAGYTTIIGGFIQQSVVNYINALTSGVSVIYSKLWAAADLCPPPTGAPPNATNTYDITSLTIATPPTGTYGTANIPISLQQIAASQISYVTIAVA